MKTLLSIIVLLITQSSICQEKTQTIVNLKDGSIVKGVFLKKDIKIRINSNTIKVLFKDINCIKFTEDKAKIYFKNDDVLTGVLNTNLFKIKTSFLTDASAIHSKHIAFIKFKTEYPQTFTNLKLFEEAVDSPILLEDFDEYKNGTQISNLFNGSVTFNDSFLPTLFSGGWNNHGTKGKFFKNALISEPRFSGKSLLLNFPKPITAVGANVFDDFDGVNRITLTVTTTSGNKISVSENFNNVGDAGFLGAFSADGIISAEFSIDNDKSHVEIDLLRISATNQK